MWKICETEPVEMPKSTETSATESPRRIIVIVMKHASNGLASPPGAFGLSCCRQRWSAAARAAAASSGSGSGCPISSCGACLGA